MKEKGFTVCLLMLLVFEHPKPSTTFVYIVLGGGPLRSLKSGTTVLAFFPPHLHHSIIQSAVNCFLQINIGLYHEVKSSNTSCLEAHASFFEIAYEWNFLS